MLRLYTMIALFIMVISIFKIEIPVANALVMGAMILVLPVLPEKNNKKERRKTDIPEFMKTTTP